MKKLNKLQINSERLMKNEELVTLRGGYGYAVCRNSNGEECGSGMIESCSQIHEFCDWLCNGNWNSSVCAGY